MALSKRKLIWRLLLVVIISIALFFAFFEFIKEEKLSIDFSAPETATSTQLAKIKEILQELDRATSTPVADWSQKIVIDLNVPFSVQAPLGNWSDPRQQDGCEETAVLMAMAWVKDKTLTPAQAEKDIIAMSDWETKNYGSFADTSAEDTANRLIKGYYQYDKFVVSALKDKNQIIKALTEGKLVLVPTNGQRLNNPYYKQPGPATHVLVIRGYDPDTDEFITNDSGTKRGEKYRYKTSVVFEAAVDYPTGDHEPIVKETKAIIIISK